METILDQEIWKDIPGFEGQYQASNMGRIKSLKFGGHEKLGERIMTLVNSPGGYRAVKLCRKRYSVHRLVMLTFVGEPNGLVVNHLDGNPSNNRLDNLEYCTQQQNLHHSRDVLKRKIGAASHRNPKEAQRKRAESRRGKPNLGVTKVPLVIVDVLKFMIEEGLETKKGLARRLGVNVQVVRKMCNGETLAYRDLNLTFE